MVSDVLAPSVSTTTDAGRGLNAGESGGDFMESWESGKTDTTVSVLQANLNIGYPFTRHYHAAGKYRLPLRVEHM